MAKHLELDYTQLKRSCSPEEFSFRTTQEIPPLEGIIGQERAVQALDFGLAVKMPVRKSWRRQSPSLPIGAMFIISRIPAVRLRCALKRGWESSLRRIWRSLCSF